jgi:hypothetical protein
VCRSVTYKFNVAQRGNLRRFASSCMVDDSNPIAWERPRSKPPTSRWAADRRVPGLRAERRKSATRRSRSGSTKNDRLALVGPDGAVRPPPRVPIRSGRSSCRREHLPHQEGGHPRIWCNPGNSGSGARRPRSRVQTRGVTSFYRNSRQDRCIPATIAAVTVYSGSQIIESLRPITAGRCQASP